MIDADRTGVGHACRRPSVESAAEADVRGAFTERDGELPGDPGEDPADHAVAVGVLMGVDVRGIAADQSAEGGKLARHLPGDHRAVGQRDDLIEGDRPAVAIGALAQIHV
jgi:hypothetical protein